MTMLGGLTIEAVGLSPVGPKKLVLPPTSHPQPHPHKRLFSVQSVSVTHKPARERSVPQISRRAINSAI